MNNNEIIKNIEVCDYNALYEIIKLNVNELFYTNNYQHFYKYLFHSVLTMINNVYKFGVPSTVLNIDECVCVQCDTITLLYNSANRYIYITYINKCYTIDSDIIDCDNNNLYSIIEYIINNN